MSVYALYEAHFTLLAQYQMYTPSLPYNRPDVHLIGPNGLVDGVNLNVGKANGRAPDEGNSLVSAVDAPSVSSVTYMEYCLV